MVGVRSCMLLRSSIQAVPSFAVSLHDRSVLILYF